jgi:hypothetical protein
MELLAISAKEFLQSEASVRSVLLAEDLWEDRVQEAVDG